MYNANSLKTGLIGLIGWRQNIDSSGIQLTDLTSTSTGLYFNDIHPLLTFDNLVSVAPDFKQLFTTPSEQNTKFTNWLKQKTEAAIIKAVDSWLEKKFTVKTANNLLKRSILFNTQGNIADTIARSNNVGLEIAPQFTRGVQVKIERIALHFSDAQTISLKLFKSGFSAPIKTQDFIISGNTMEWFDLTDWTLEGNHTYWLVYDSSSITGNAINGVKKYDYENQGYVFFPYDSKIGVTAISTSESIASIFDVSKLQYSVSQNYGLNLDMNAQCDYTSFIVEQKNLFKTVIARQVAVDILRELAYNPNSNINRNVSNIQRNEILFEIEGDTQGRKGGLKKDLEDAIDAIMFDTTRIDKDCLPCKKVGVKYSVV